MPSPTVVTMPGAPRAREPSSAGRARRPRAASGRRTRGSGRRRARPGTRRASLLHGDPPQRYFTIRAKSSGSRLAPPTSAPSISGMRHELADVARLHAAPVLDADACARRRRRSARASVARISPTTAPASAGLGVAAGADGPDRLVRDDERGRLLRRRRRRAPRRTCRATFVSVPPASRSSSVSPTHRIGRHAVREHRPHLLVHQLVVLAEQLPALASGPTITYAHFSAAASAARPRR